MHLEHAGLNQIFIQATSISVAPVIVTSSSNVVEKTAAGWPAAAQTTSYLRNHGSTYVGTGAGCANGETPPITWPVWRRTKSGFARRSCGTPMVAATFAVSTRCAPEVSTSTGAPSASKSRLLAIAPTSQPSASAASAAVCTASGSTTISPVPPRLRWSSRNLVIEGCSFVILRDPSVVDARTLRGLPARLTRLSRGQRGERMSPQRPAVVTGAVWLSVGVIAAAGLTALMTLVFKDELVDAWAADR